MTPAPDRAAPAKLGERKASLQINEGNTYQFDRAVAPIPNHQLALALVSHSDVQNPQILIADLNREREVHAFR